MISRVEIEAVTSGSRRQMPGARVEPAGEQAPCGEQWAIEQRREAVAREPERE